MGGAPEEVPNEVITRAKAAFGRRARGELAVLAWDSLVDEDGPPADHRLRFDHREVQVTVRLLPGDISSDIEGLLQPRSSRLVELQSDQGLVLRSTQTTDGTFAFDQIPSGMVRLCLQAPATPEVCTDWFRI
jgi:hypothetical protein